MIKIKYIPDTHYFKTKFLGQSSKELSGGMSVRCVTHCRNVMAVNCAWLVPIWGRFGDSYLGECHRSYNEWWKTRHGDVGGQPGDNNEHCDLRGCASRPPLVDSHHLHGPVSRGESELGGKRVVLPPPSRTIHNARGESPGYRRSSSDICIMISIAFFAFFDHLILIPPYSIDYE